jgi:hypothetical protein
METPNTHAGRLTERIIAAIIEHLRTDHYNSTYSKVLSTLEHAPADAPDDKSFNAGFDAAVRAILKPSALTTVNFQHPQYLRDRRAKFDEFRNASVFGART